MSLKWLPYYRYIHLYCRHFNGTNRAMEHLLLENYTYFNIVVDEIKADSNANHNYFMEACK